MFKKKNLTFGVILFFVFATSLFLITSDIPNYIIDGDVVYFSDSNVFLSASPHTLPGGGWVTFNITSKVYTGDVDIVLGFDTTSLIPKKVQRYNPTNEVREDSYVCETGYFSYTVSPNYAWCYNNVTTYNNITLEYTNELITIFERSFDRGDIGAKTIYWNVSYEDVWKDIPASSFNSINYDYQGMNKWWYAQNFPIVQDTNYTFRVKITPVNMNVGYRKYWFAIKPSSESIHEAISNNHFYALDPWTQDLTVGLTDYWSFDEQSGTNIGNNISGSRNGTLSGGASWNSTGLIGGGIYTNTTTENHGVNFTNIPSLNGTTANYTFNMWVKYIGNAGATGARIFGYNNLTIDGFDGKQEMYFDTPLDLIYNIGSENVVEQISTGLDLSEPTSFVMITFAKNSTHVIFYQNGISGYVGAQQGSPFSPGHMLYLNLKDGSDSAEIMYDEMAIWNRTLTPTEITTIWNSGAGLDYVAGYTPLIVSNETIPSSPTFGDQFYINMSASDADNDDITSVYFSITRPNSTIVINKENGTWVSGDSFLGGVENWFSSNATIDNVTGSVGTWLWNFTVVSNNTAQQNSTSSGNFTLNDVFIPKVFIDSFTEDAVKNQNISIRLNFSAIDDIEVDNCWYNLDGGDNVTISNCLNTTFGALNTSHNLTVYANDTSNNINFTTIQNFSVLFDVISPTFTITDPTGTLATQTIVINMNVSDLGGVNQCYFNITRGASTEVSNTRINNCANYTTTVSSDADYIAHFWANDTTGNANKTTASFTVDTSSSSSGGGGGGGGGGTPAVITFGNWTMATQGGGANYQMNMISGTKRGKGLYFSNQGSSSRAIALSCEKPAGYSDLCNYITFEKNSFILPLIKGVNTIIDFEINIPKDLEDGEYISSLIGTDEDGNIGAVTVETSVGGFNIFVQIGTKLSSSKKFGDVSIPYIFISFMIMVLLFPVLFYTGFKKLPGGAGWAVVISIVVGLGALTVI